MILRVAQLLHHVSYGVQQTSKHQECLQEFRLACAIVNTAPLSVLLAERCETDESEGQIQGLLALVLNYS